MTEITDGTLVYDFDHCNKDWNLERAEFFKKIYNYQRKG